jgi:putative ABC transport system substrate-binding protein
MVGGAQQAATLVVGFLNSGTPETSADRDAAFRSGLRKIGFVEGRNVVIEQRWWGSSNDRIPALVADLVNRKVDVIVAAGGSAQAAVAATSTIPLVLLIPGDPVKSGLVSSIGRPGRNATGVSMFAFTLGPKRFQWLHETVPNARLMAVLANPTQPDPASKEDVAAVEASAREAGQRTAIFNASTLPDFEPAFASMEAQGAEALLVMGDPFFNNARETLVALAARHALPAIWEWREMALGGGLMSYGSSLRDAYRLLGDYTGQILNGAKPGELPVDQAVKVELVLNLKTAKTLGLTFPLSLLARADEVIE